ncbi:hypothetical protein GYB22_13720 [bacterium]|nr:hypothetical protein [bacterium]
MRYIITFLAFYVVLSGQAQSIYWGEQCVDPQYDSLYDFSGFDTSRSVYYLGNLPIPFEECMSLGFKYGELQHDSAFMRCDSQSCYLEIHGSLKLPLFVNSELIYHPEEQSYILATINPEEVRSLERKNLVFGRHPYFKIYLR